MGDFYEEGMRFAWITPVFVLIIVVLVLSFPEKANEILAKMSR